jgi:hypothetical protein
MEQTNLDIKRGDSKSYTLTFRDEEGSVIDITGWTVFFTVKDKIDDTDETAVLKKTITSHTDPTNGKTKIELSSTDTNLVGNYIYDIQIKKDTNEINTILEGNITFAKDVTRRTS